MPIEQNVCFADIQLDWVKRQGFGEVILSIGHHGDRIREYCGNGTRYGLTIRYAEDGERALGTGGAVRQALSAVAPWTAVLYGDTILSVDCSAVVAAAAASGRSALMTVIQAPPAEVANAKLEAGLVRYDKSRPDPTWSEMDYGFLVLSDRFVRMLPPSGAYDLAAHLAAASLSGELAGYRATEPFWQINDERSLEVFRRHFGGLVRR
jgi:NDP-sugar pyrophosphorylase family protein